MELNGKFDVPEGSTLTNAQKNDLFQILKKIITPLPIMNFVCENCVDFLWKNSHVETVSVRKNFFLFGKHIIGTERKNPDKSLLVDGFKITWDDESQKYSLFSGQLDGIQLSKVLITREV
jgi:hypothetical protein